MPEVNIAAETRDEFGKGAARRIRREGRVPAVLYGHGTETRHLTLPGHDLMRALRTSNVLLRVEGLKNGSEIALPKAVQRDPLTGIIEHVDLILVRRGEKVTIEVPVRITGEIAPGDGMLDQQLVQITVEAEATNIPQGIDVDVEGMDIGQAVHASDLKLPPGVSLQVEPETLVLAVIARSTAEEPEEGEEAPEVPEALDETAADSEGAQAADRGTLDRRRPRQPGAGVRGQQAQRGAYGDGPARRARRSALQGAPVGQRHRRGPARRGSRHAGPAALLHEPVR